MSFTDGSNVSAENVNDHIGLALAAQQSPGRPSTSSVGRWCVNGIKTPDGARIRLRHIRVGKKVFTRRVWMEAFWSALAEQNTAYFDARASRRAELPPRDPAYGPPKRRSAKSVPDPVNTAAARRREEVHVELDREGL